jgi:hypothetical protein
MQQLLRKSPMILSGVFIFITLTRVAELADSGFQAGVLGWVFSIAMGVSVFVSSYYMRVAMIRKGGEEDRRSKLLRRTAAVAMVFFVVIDGVFNVVEVMRSLDDSALYYPALIYGAFPTVAAALLGSLQGYVDRIPMPPPRGFWKGIQKRIIKILELWIDTTTEKWQNRITNNTTETVNIAPKPAQVRSKPLKPKNTPASKKTPAERVSTANYDAFIDYQIKNGYPPLSAGQIMVEFGVNATTANKWRKDYEIERKSVPPV